MVGVHAIHVQRVLQPPGAVAQLGINIKAPEVPPSKLVQQQALHLPLLACARLQRESQFSLLRTAVQSHRQCKTNVYRADDNDAEGQYQPACTCIPESLTSAHSH